MQSLTGKRLIVFGCGYVGSAIALAAASRGAEVTTLTRNTEKAARLRELGLRVLEADLTSNAWHTSLEGAYDFAANTISASASTPEAYRAAYVGGMQSILAWAQGHRIGTMLYTSSTGVYPQGMGAQVDETASTEGASATGRVLLEAEAMLRAANMNAVERSFILRCAGIYGPGRHHLLNALRAGTTTFPGQPDCRLNLIHRDDIVSAALACFTAPRTIGSDVFNLADGAPSTRAEVLRWLARAVGAGEPAFDQTVMNSRRGGEPTPDREIVAEKIRHVLTWKPRYSDFRAGYAAILNEV